MIIVGELINSSRKAIKEAIDKGDIEYIKKIAVDQEEAGATYIDVNAGTFVGTEIEHLKWMIENIQQVVDIPCCIDSPDPKALEAALKVHKGTAMINSISLEEDRYDAVLPVVAGTDLKIVALCMSSDGMPETCDQRLKKAGIKEKYIFMIGGAPVTSNFAKRVNADYYTADAASAARLAEKILLQKHNS